MRNSAFRFIAYGCCALALLGCMEPLTVEAEDSSVLEIGESRSVELRFLRFDVTDFEQVLTLEDLQALPQEVQERLWLVDLDLSNGPGSPHLMDNALQQILEMDPTDLSPAARNMQNMLNMTPDTADLSETRFEEMLELGPLIGIATGQVLADLVGINVEDTFLPTELITQTILDGVIGTHPNAQQRLGPRTLENPEGLYPVAVNALPITLEDVVSNFATLGERFGPIYVDGVYHPGFIDGQPNSVVITEDFQMTVRANANALPYKGIDLSNSTSASVNSVASQIEDMFDFNDPDWFMVEGLVEGVPTIEEMTFYIEESDDFIFGGNSPLPTPFGNSDAWRLPAWSFEQIVATSGMNTYRGVNANIEYHLSSQEDPVMSLDVTNGWVEIFTAGGLGSPPPESYFWDVLLEVAQVRLHDDGLAEGEADVAFTLRDVPIGVDSETISASIRENLEADPSALIDVATTLIDTTLGEADFYYYRPTDKPNDWLFYVSSSDMGVDENGAPRRAYGYDDPGFFADEALTERISSFVELDGDTIHEKILILSGDTLFISDNTSAVFRLDIGEKPSDYRIQMEITRVR